MSSSQAAATLACLDRLAWPALLQRALVSCRTAHRWGSSSNLHLQDLLSCHSHPSCPLGHPAASRAQKCKAGPIICPGYFVGETYG